MTRTVRRMSVILIVAVAVSAGCATRAEVEGIVAETNAAMLGPYLDRAGADQPQGWGEAISRIDRLIELHPDQKVLVNHLRVRQAMLLTVHAQQNLANAKWAEVEAPHLQGNTRDLALYKARGPLTWAFLFLPPQELLNVDERNTGKAHAKTLWDGAPALDPDLAAYFRTLATEIRLKVANSTTPNDDVESRALVTAMAKDLKAYLEAATDAEARWADSTKAERRLDLATARGVDLLRHSVWLDELTGAFEKEASNIQLTDGKAPSLGLRWELAVTVQQGGNAVNLAVVTIDSPRHGSHRTETDSSGNAKIGSIFPGTVVVRAVKGTGANRKSARVTVKLDYGREKSVTLDLD